MPQKELNTRHGLDRYGVQAAELRQRADYTQAFNTKTGRHGWLRLTPAYSVKMVEEIISDYRESLNVLDPFCGTGTTALCAVARGHRATTVDINPFLIWFAHAKTRAYSQSLLAETKRTGLEALDAARREAIPPVQAPDIHKIERWWPEAALRFLAHLKASILASETESAVRDLLHVAFCRTLIKLSNAAFNHQSMSFKDSNGSRSQGRLQIDLDASALFLDDLAFVLRGASDSPLGTATVLQDDARNLHGIAADSFDLVVTSPPYANRMSYIRELRPYMYWLGYLTNASDAGELDWQAIGGTWGVATSRLGTWSRHRRLPEGVDEIVTRIAAQANANSGLLATYVAKYCEDMARHFHSLRRVLKKDARVHYIVGNSTFYGVLVPTEQLYATMLRECGFADVAVRPIRKRNSKKALVEFDVSGAWPGRGYAGL